MFQIELLSCPKLTRLLIPVSKHMQEQFCNPEGIFPNGDQTNSGLPDYAITIKADGMRQFIFFSEIGVFMFNPISRFIIFFGPAPTRRFILLLFLAFLIDLLLKKKVPR